MTPSLVGLSAAELSARLSSGDVTVAEVTAAHLDRIGATNRRGPELNAVITVNDAGRVEAERLDSAGDRAGRLFGLPVLVKDNIDVEGLPTTAGSVLLAEHRPADDAFLVARLREEGAVVLGKANLSEWANFRSHASSSGWSALGGQTRNPHVLDRTPCGSSSGSAVAVAAGLAPLAVGTETDGSILCPAAVNGIVGIKPTVGLVSRDGIVPVAHSQDTAGPMARTVADAAMLLEVIAAADPTDPAMTSRPVDLDLAFRRGLRDDALQGARIGVLVARHGLHPKARTRYDEAIRDLQSLGAVLVPVAPLDPAVRRAALTYEYEVLLHEFPDDVEAYLTGVDGLSTLEDLIAGNRRHADVELQWFGQEVFEEASARRGRDPARYRAARDTSRRTFAGFVDGRFAEHDLDAIVTPTQGPAGPIDLLYGDSSSGGASTTSITAVSGYPAVTVPMGTVHGLPVGLSFVGLAWTEGRLLALAHAYERATHHRVNPRFLPTLGGRGDHSGG